MGLFDLSNTRKDKGENTTPNTFVCDVCTRTFNVCCRHHDNVCCTCARGEASSQTCNAIELKNATKTEKVHIMDWINKKVFEYGHRAMNSYYATLGLEKKQGKYYCNWDVQTTHMDGTCGEIEIPTHLVVNDEINWDKFIMCINGKSRFLTDLDSEFKPFVITPSGVILPKGLTCIECGKELTPSEKMFHVIVEKSDCYKTIHSINGQPYCDNCFSYRKIAIEIPNSGIHIYKRQYSTECEFYFQTWGSGQVPIAGKIPNELISSNKIDSEALYLYIKSKHECQALICRHSAYIVDLENWSVTEK